MSVALWQYAFLAALFAVPGSIASDSEHQPPPTLRNSDFKRSLSNNCDAFYSLTCLKLDIVSWVEKVNEQPDYAVLPGVSLVKENSSSENTKETTANIVADLAREFPNDPDSRLDMFLMRKVANLINSHSIKLKLASDNGDARGSGGGGLGGGGKGGGGGMGYLLAAGAMMKGTLLALAMAGLAAVAGKALMASLMALMLSALAGLKGGGGGGGKTTYEVVAKPVYTQSHSHSVSHEDYGGHGGHSGYGRSFADQPLPISLRPDYKPGQ